MPSVYANGRSITHKGDKLVNTCAIPDVCKTPSPGGPIPIPYVNVAMDSDLDKGAKKVKIEDNAVALESSNLKTSTGDEPGSAGGGIISSKTKGKMTWGSASLDVKAEGKGVIRLLDVTQHNGNTFNAFFIQPGATGLAYGDDKPCGECKKDPATHRLYETDEVSGLVDLLIARLNAVGASALKKKGRGYMIGVLVCNCGQRYAAASGTKDLAVFAATAKKAGFIPCATPSISDFSNGKGPIKDADAKFKRVAGKAANQCAAPKCVQKCNEDGHTPVALSEKWYSPKVDVSVRTAILRITADPGNPKQTRFDTDEESYGHGESVPSCAACQENLPKLLCKDKPKCGK